MMPRLEWRGVKWEVEHVGRTSEKMVFWTRILVVGTEPSGWSQVYFESGENRTW